MELQTSVDVNSTGANLSATNGVCESASSSEQSGQAEDSLSSANLCQQPETSNSHPANPFHVDTSKIATVPANEQDAALQELGLTVYNQDEFELGVMAQVDQAMAEEEKERLRKMLTKQLTSVEDDLRTCKQDLKHVDKVLSMIPSQGGTASKESQRKMEAVKRQRENKLKQLRKLRAKQKSLKMKLDGNTDGLDEDDAEDGGSSMLEEALGLGTSSKETDQERMVRLGEMTPFGSVVNFQDGSSTSQSNSVPPSPARSTISQVSDFEKFLMDKDISAIQKGKRKKSGHENNGRKKMKAVQAEPIMSPLHDGSSEWSPKKKIKDQNYKFKRKGTNYFDSKDKRVYRPAELDFSQPRFERYRKTRYPKFKHNFSEDSALDFSVEGDDDDYIPDERELRHTWLYEDDIDEGRKKPKKMGRGAKGQVSSVPGYHSDDEDGASSLHAIKSQYLPRKKASRDLPISKSRDDGNEKCYLARIRELKLAKLKKKHKDVLEDGDSGSSSSEDSDTEQSMEFDGGFIVPGKIWKKLYRYQKTGVKWLWELHGQQAGGIVGDEMGLGKTIQIIAFLTGLKISQLRDKGSKYRGLGPVLIVCPTTVMHQWVREFHTWWPLHRVAILHSTGSYSGSEKNLIHNIVKAHSILVTSYSHVVIHQDTLLEYDWHYVILDEGHKIRNPDAQITIACKQFRTCHRLILSGSPVQNNLKELWSLLDFVFPGKLGTLPDFMQHFSVPIVQGGYSNASDVQVQTAYKCACVLRDTINPYLLRRMKADVKNNLNLPQKSEQVLFCRLTEEQRDVYQEYLDSKECNMILAGNYMVFPGLITLRKVCNHPDLCTGGPKEYLSCQPVETTEASEYGYWKRSGKMIVISSLLKLWKKQGQRVLLFTQSRQMMTILETFVEQQGYTFLRMDGSTPISARQSLINQFNDDTSYFLFLLTTRVGGLGVNLTGANRVVIFDPDWNPSTDTQARERAWRIGQKRNVTVYRLVTTGTIEEKIYHRQIFKQFLTNRVLKDPKQRRFFKSNDLYELFTLGDDDKQNSTETSAIFAGTGSDVRVQPRPVGKHDPGKKNYFDEMKEKARAEKDKFIDDDEVDEFEEERNKDTEGEIEAEKGSDSGIKTDEEKRMKMRKLAKMLSQKLVQTDNYGTKPETGQTDVLNTISDRAMSSDRLLGTSTCTTTSTTASHEKTDDCSVSTGKLNSQKTKATDSVEKSKGKKAAKDSKHEKHKHKKKRKKKKDAEFEGEKIAHLDKHQAYKQANEEEESKKSAEQDDYVLQRLFKKSGVHSAMQHDTIMQSSDPDYALVEAEADRVAREAARALKTSRARCLGASSGVPTWTGQRGGSGAPGAKPRFGAKKNSRLLTEPGSKPVTAQVTAIKSKEVAKAPVPTRHFDGSVAGTSKSTGLTSSIPNVMSSKELLARMRSRNNVAIGQSEDGEDGAVSMGANQEVDELMTEIRNFVAFQGTIDGQASTTELLDAFGSKLPASDSARFKAMLQQICNFVRQDGVGIWRLKPEFK